MKVSLAVDEYLIAHYQLSPQTLRWYTQKLGVFAHWCDEHAIQTEDLHQSVMNRFMVTAYERNNPQTGKPVSTYTLHGYAQVLRGFINWLGTDDVIDEVRVIKILKGFKPPRVDKKVIEVFTDDHIQRLYAACKQEFLPKLVARDEAMIAVLLSTGIRVGEFVGLTLDNVHLREGYIKVTGKGRAQREVPLDNDAKLRLSRYINRHRQSESSELHVFLSREDTPLSGSGAYQIIDRLGEWGHVRGVRCCVHDFRHTFAYRFMRDHSDIYRLSRLLGHTSIKMTAEYVKALPDFEIRKVQCALGCALLRGPIDI